MCNPNGFCRVDAMPLKHRPFEPAARLRAPSNRDKSSNETLERPSIRNHFFSDLLWVNRHTAVQCHAQRFRLLRAIMNARSLACSRPDLLSRQTSGTN